MFTKWKELKDELSVKKEYIKEIYKNEFGNWKIHLRDEYGVFVEITFFIKERRVLGTYYDTSTSDEGIIIDECY